MTKKKKQEEAPEDEQDEEMKREMSMKAKTKNLKQKGFLGVSTVIKLPFVIGTPEYEKHPFAGIVFSGLGSAFE